MERLGLTRREEAREVALDLRVEELPDRADRVHLLVHDLLADAPVVLVGVDLEVEDRLDRDLARLVPVGPRLLAALERGVGVEVLDERAEEDVRADEVGRGRTLGVVNRGEHGRLDRLLDVGVRLGLEVRLERLVLAALARDPRDRHVGTLDGLGDGLGDLLASLRERTHEDVHDPVRLLVEDAVQLLERALASARILCDRLRERLREIDREAVRVERQLDRLGLGRRLGFGLGRDDGHVLRRLVREDPAADLVAVVAELVPGELVLGLEHDRLLELLASELPAVDLLEPEAELVVTLGVAERDLGEALAIHGLGRGALFDPLDLRHGNDRGRSPGRPDGDRVGGLLDDRSFHDAAGAEVDHVGSSDADEEQQRGER